MAEVGRRHWLQTRKGGILGGLDTGLSCLSSKPRNLR